MMLCCDSLDVRPSDLPPYAAVITDPPYGEHVHANTTSIGSNGQGTRKRDLGFEAATDSLRAHVAALAAGASRWSVVFSDVESTHLWREAVAPRKGSVEYLRAIPWIRWSQPQLSGDRPPTGCEMVSVFHPKGRKRWNGAGNMTHLPFHPVRIDGKHPTEKPLDLMLALVSAFSDPGERIVDPFAGFGTTLLAARLLGRDAIGIERTPDWCERASVRLAAELSGHDIDRAVSWALYTAEESRSVPYPTKPSMRRTWERAQRRLADAERVIQAVS